MDGKLEFEALVERYYEPLYRFAFGLTGSGPDACDLVQETLYIWARKKGQLKEPGRVKSWLFTTLHREFLQAKRRLARFPEGEFDPRLAGLPPVEPKAIQRLDGERAVGLLKRLDPVFQAPLVLFYLEDCGYEEIATILELPLGTVKSRLSRGLAQLRQLFGRQPAASERGQA
jgi:RNA polymerase sigma-70 factor (ECF subfamily)